MGGQTDIVAVLRWLEVGDVSLVEGLQRVGGGTVLSYLVEERDKLLVLLSIHLLEFDGKIARLLQGVAGEEVRRVVILTQHLLLLSRHHRGELVQVANHEELHTAERQVVALAKLSEHGIDGIEQVAAHHTDLVDDQKVDASDDVALRLAELKSFLFAPAKGSAGHIGRERQLEERVDGHSPGVDGGDARRSQHHHSLGRKPLEFLEEGCLTRARLSREEEVGTRLLYDVPCHDGFFVHFHELSIFLKSSIFLLVTD